MRQLLADIVRSLTWRWWALALACAAGPRTAEARPEPEVDEATELAQARFEEALAVYLEGDLEGARDALQRLLDDTTLEGTPVHTEVRIYLGEVHYYLDDPYTAENLFRSVVLADPAYELDVMVHPPDVSALFERVRAEVARGGDLLPPAEGAAPPLSPVLVLVPGGLQFHNRQPAYGGVVLGGVAGLALASGGLRVALLRVDDDPVAYGIQVRAGTTEEDRARTLKAFNQVTGWGAAALWVTTFAQGAVVAGRSARVVVEPGAIGLHVRW